MPSLAPFPKLLRYAAHLLLPCLFTAHVLASVTVTQNSGAGATSWPGSPLISTVSNPSTELTVAESFGTSTYTSYAQSFTLSGTENYTLQSIYLYAGGGSGTTTTATVTLNLYDVVGSIAPNPSSYSAGVNLFGGGSGIPISYTPQSNGLLRLDFAGSDQVKLLAGHLYVFELAGVGGTTPLNWLRTVAEKYANGAAYRNRAWINGTNAREFGLAVYGVVNTDPLPPTQCTVDASVVHQQIDGFGAGVVFLDSGLSPLSDPQMDQLYGTDAGQFGLTLIRVRIAPYGDFSEAVANGKKAHARGARILATPWTPPAAMKDNNNTVGGALLPAQYASYVTYLNQFSDAMAANSAPVSVISLQNEADYLPTYESCIWTAAQFRTFCRDFAGAINVPVMMPESLNFNLTLSDAALNDAAAAANIDYVGGHLYGATIRDYPLAHSLGKPTWMTEFLLNDQTLTSALETARQITDCLTIGNMSAYIWWKNIGNANGLLNASGAPQRRGYVMAQFSRFVRPGDVRIGISNNTSSLGLTAFQDKSAGSGRFALVAVNSSTAPITHQFALTGLTLTSITPWITSATQSLEAQAPLPLTGGTFTYTIPASAIVTFAGDTSPAAFTGTITRVETPAGHFQFTFGPLQAGWTYTPESCTDLVTANWQTLANYTATDNATERTFTDLATSPDQGRFYRVRATPTSP